MDPAALDAVALAKATTPQVVLALLPPSVAIEELETRLRVFSAEQLNSVVSGKTPLTMAAVFGRALWVRFANAGLIFAFSADRIRCAAGS